MAALLLLGAGITIPLSATTTATATTPVWFAPLWAVFITVPLAWRRSLPVPTATIVICVFLAGQATVTPEPLISQIAPFVALYSVGAWGPNRRRAAVARAIFVAALIAWVVVVIVIAPVRLPQQLGNLSASSALGLAALSNAIYLGAAIGFGETAWRSARRRAVLEVRTDELQTERERTAEQAVALERVRIARELHDVIAHHVSVIAIQAGAARRVLRTSPDKASASLAAIEQNSRQAIEELHRTLEALRRPDTPEVPSRAVSTLRVEQIGELVAEAKRTGTPTTLEILGEPRPLPPATGLTLFRITQEALTNVRKHAGSGASATVRLRYTARSVTLEVRNTNRNHTTEPALPGGMGQLGMRERVSTLGGTFEARAEEHGYVVSVSLPV